jgi:hypothetical protein
MAVAKTSHQTDGTPAGEPRDQVFRAIINANNELGRTRYGADAVSYQFAQVGNDLKARDFLGEIDSHPQVGGLVDCTFARGSSSRPLDGAQS